MIRRLLIASLHCVVAGILLCVLSSASYPQEVRWSGDTPSVSAEDDRPPRVGPDGTTEVFNGAMPNPLGALLGAFSLFGVLMGAIALAFVPIWLRRTSRRARR